MSDIDTLFSVNNERKRMVYKRFKYLFCHHFRSVCCGWSSFW